MKRRRNLIAPAIILAWTARTLLAPDQLKADPSMAVHLEDAIITGHGDTLNVYEIPASDSASGTIKHYDIECHVVVTADGSVSLQDAKVTASAVLPDVEHFLPGDYQSVSGNDQISVTGPVPASGGRVVWAYAGASNWWRGGTWTTGPLLDHPLLGSLPKGVILPRGFSFGQSAGGDLIAVQQLGENLLIASLSKTTDENNQVKYVVSGFTIFKRKPTAPN